MMVGLSKRDSGKGICWWGLGREVKKKTCNFFCKYCFFFCFFCFFVLSASRFVSASSFCEPSSVTSEAGEFFSPHTGSEFCLLFLHPFQLFLLMRCWFIETSETAKLYRFVLLII